MLKESIMSFEPLKEQKTASTHGRSCLIFYHLSGRELQTAKNLAALLGLRDLIYLSPKNSKTGIQALLDGEVLSGEEEGPKCRAIFFNEIPPQKLSAFMDHLKRLKVTGILYASITETSIQWTVEELLANLLAERKAFQEGKPSSH